MTEHAPETSFSVVVGDASEHVRAALVTLIDAHPELHVVGASGDADEVIALCARLRPSAAVVEVLLSPRGEHVHEMIGVVSQHTLVVVHTSRPDRRSGERLRAAGVHAVFVKGSPMDIAGGIHALVDRVTPRLAT